MRSSTFIKTARASTILTSSLVCLISMTVIYGWFTNSLALVQIRPEFVSMKFNTALLFLVTGMGILLIAAQKYHAATFCGASVVLIAAITLSQTLFNIDLYIDRLIIKQDFSIHSLAPGRMAVNTALCFIMSGTAIIFMSRKHSENSLILPSKMLTSFIFALSTASLFGYIIGLDIEFGWGRHLSMAVHTAVAFLLISVSLISVYLWNRNQPFSSLTIPFMVIVSTIMLTLSAILSVAVRNQQETYAQSELQGEIEKVSISLNQTIRSLVDPMKRSAKRWQLREGIPENEWYQNAYSYISMFDEMRALEWINNDFVVKWVAPEKGNEAIKNFDLKSDIKRHSIILAAKEKNQTSISKSFQLRQGGRGFIIYQPLVKKGEFNGFLASVIDVEKMFRHAISTVDPSRRLWIQVIEGGQVIFSSFAPSETTAKNTRHFIETDFDTYEMPLKIKLMYLNHTETGIYSVLPYIVFVLGLLVTALLYRSIQGFIHSKKLLERINIEHKRFKQVIEAAPGAMIQYNPNGEISFANSKASSLFGYSNKHLLEKNIHDLTPRMPLQIDMTVEANKKSADNDSVKKSGRTKARHRNGNDIPVEFEFCHIGSNTENSILVSFFDLTERTLKEEALRVTNGVLDRTSRMAQVGGWELDLKTEKLTWSDETYRIHGLDSSYQPKLSEAIDFYAPEAQGEITAAVERAVNTGEAWDLELPFIQATGNKIWVRAQGKIQYEDNVPTRMVGAFQNITDRRKVLEELEVRNEELNRFTSAASHDLRAPLRGISQLVHWLGEDLEGKIDDESKEKIRLIQTRTQRLDTLLSDLLDYARVGQKNGAVRSVNLHKTFLKIFELCKQNTAFTMTIKSEDIHFETYTAPFELVIRNLISNAIKHHPGDDGEIIITVSDEGAMYRISIADDGNGIPEKSHERAFAMFQTLQSKDKTEGSGMGLSIIKKTVESFGGTISLENNTPKGTVFTFTWPKNIS